MSPRVNLKMLAKELGLAISTVSKALQDSHEISPDTKERVLKLAKELHYQPNPYASSLRRQRSQHIAVIVPAIAEHFFSLAINGIESVARERNYHVLVYQTHDDDQKEESICRHLQNGRTDGVIMSVTAQTANYDHLVELHSKGIPIVLFDRVCNAIATAKVTTNDFESGYKATEHLLAQGAQHIAYLSISSLLSIDNQRRAGYLEAMRQHGHAPDMGLVVACGNEEQEAHEKIRALLSSPQRPDAVFASVEKLALTTYRVCHELGLHLPQDLKVICFANLKTADLLNPPLSTITQPAFEMGRAAARILFQHLDKRRTAIPEQTIVFKSALVERASTSVLLAKQLI